MVVLVVVLVSFLCGVRDGLFIGVERDVVDVAVAVDVWNGVGGVDGVECVDVIANENTFKFKVSRLAKLSYHTATTSDSSS